MSVNTFLSIKKRIQIPFSLFSVGGLSPEKIAFSITIGIIAGIFPVIGTTTVLSLLLTIVFRQNLLIVQSVQWLMALAQVLLIIPFIQAGSYLIHGHALPVTMSQINLAFTPGILNGIKTIGIFHLYAIFSWVILSLPAGVISYFAFRAIFQKKIHDQLKYSSWK